MTVGDVGTPDRHRGVFPLPMPATERSLLNQPKFSRRCSRRLKCREHVDAWVDDMVISLNSMFLGKEFMANSSLNVKPNQAQQLCLGRLRDSVLRLGRPPEDVTGLGALRELQAAEGYSGEPAALARFQRELLSLPVAGSVAPSLDTILGPRAQEIFETLRSKLHNSQDVATRKQECGLKAPYYDPVLRSCRGEYVSFVQQLDDANLIEFRTEVREHVGVFTVWKKNGKQRMIVDARLSNLWFDSPEPVSLATGSSFALIEVDSGPPIHLGGVDIADAFYHIGLPEEFRDLFSLKPLRAAEVGLTSLNGVAVPGKQLVYPVFKVVPMGWAQALWLCQRCHEMVVDSMGCIPPSLRFVDGFPIPAVKPYIHTQYVDNFVALSQRPHVAAEIASQVGRALNERQLPTHAVEASAGGDTLGWHFDEERPQVMMTPRRLWKLKMGIEELLDQGWASGKLIEKVVGHLTFAALLRRELLSCFEAVYVFIKKHYATKVRLWPQVRRELFWAKSLLPLVSRDLGAEWSPEVFACDASTWGRGVAKMESEVSKVRAQARIQDRWRFSQEQEKALLRAEVTGAGSCGDIWEYEQARMRERSLPVPELDPSFLSGDWKRVDSRQWSRQEPIVILEGRALVWTVQHLVRCSRNHGRRHLIITDSMSNVLALTKGRGGTSASNRICRQVGSLSLACGLQLHYRWCASELNAADAPSRGRPIGEYEFELGVEKLVNAQKECWSSSSWRRQAALFYEGCFLKPNQCRDFASQRATLAGWGEREEGETEPGREQAKKVWEPDVPQSQKCPANNLPGKQDRDRQPSEDISRRLGQIEQICQCPPAANEHPVRGRHSSGMAAGQHVLRRGEPGSWHDALGVGEASPVRCDEVECDGAIDAGHEGVQKTGPTSGQGADPISNACADVYLHDRTSQKCLGSSVDADDLGNMLSAWRMLETERGATGQAQQDQPQMVSDSVSFVSFGRKGTAEQDRRHGRRHHLGSSLPPVDESGVSAHQNEQEDQRASHSTQHEGAQQSVCQGSRRMWISRSWCPVQLPDQAWVSLNGHAQPTAQCGGANEEGPLEDPEQLETVRTGRSSQPSLRQAQQDRAKKGLKGRARPATCPSDLSWMQKAPKNSLFLELFSGKAGMSRAMKHRLSRRFSVVSIDIINNGEHDLAKKSFQRFILHLIHSQQVAGVWLGTPCTSWSRARRNDGHGPPPLRSDAQLWGLRNLTAEDQARVDLGNKLARFSFKVFQDCVLFDVPVALENPFTSRLWLLPVVRKLCQHPSVSFCVTDYCQDGAPWRKRTRVLFSHVDLSHAGQLCEGARGVCSRTHKRHVQLSGTLNGKFLTLIAQPYPKNFCRRVATAFSHAMFHRLSRPLMTSLGFS